MRPQRLSHNRSYSAQLGMKLVEDIRTMIA